MRRVSLAVLALTAMVIAQMAPAEAQEPRLGFEIDHREGVPGDVVNAQVDVDDVAEFCVTDLEEFRDGLFEWGETMVEPLLAEFYPPDSDYMITDTYEQLAFLLMVLPIELAAFISGEIAAMILDETFVVTFADPVSQDPVGDNGNFDPNTGEGSVVVPEVDPGLWAVAAACVELTSDPADVIEAADEGAAFLQEQDIDLPLDISDLEGVERLLDLAEYSPTLLANIMVPYALGVELYCVLDADGFCAVPPPPVPFGPDGENGPGAPGNGEDPSGNGEDPSGNGAGAPADPVTVSPTFTG